MINITEAFTTRMKLLIPTYEYSHGEEVKTYPSFNDGININVSFKAYGGTEVKEKSTDNMLVVYDTVSITTWYDSRIASDCRLALSEGVEYEILGVPENIDMRNKFMKFKIQRISGGV